MLRPHQHRAVPEFRGKRGTSRTHQMHPLREIDEAIEKEAQRIAKRPPTRRHRDRPLKRR
jgi:hypothetical protein